MVSVIRPTLFTGRLRARAISLDDCPVRNRPKYSRIAKVLSVPLADASRLIAIDSTIIKFLIRKLFLIREKHPINYKKDLVI
jgi:hypothetical protein